MDKWSTEAELLLPTDKLPASLLSIQALALHSLLIVICLCLMFTASLRKCGRCEQKHVKARGYSKTLPLLVAANILRTVLVGSVIHCANIVPEFSPLFFSRLLFSLFYFGDGWFFR